MFLNYRIELCRSCYFKRAGHCRHSDAYIQNRQLFPPAPGGECPHRVPIPWLPE
ncbi:hypothetical protein CEB3_c24290 [Peptococcaceae bacterium CEB3]|nr:hypothetical protein CEB3_c24290 [Peptococcaceae bacterium CEB3]